MRGRAPGDAARALAPYDTGRQYLNFTEQARGPGALLHAGRLPAPARGEGGRRPARRDARQPPDPAGALSSGRTAAAGATSPGRRESPGASAPESCRPPGRRVPPSYGRSARATERRPTMVSELTGKRIAVLAADGVEQVELERPVAGRARRRRGSRPDLARGEQIQAFNHLDKGDRFDADRTVGDAAAEDYDGLLLPGGVANPDFLRTDERAVGFARAFFEQDKPVARDLPRTVDARRGRCAEGPHDHLLAEPADRHPQRRRQLGRRGGPRRQAASSPAASRTTCRRSARRSSRSSPGTARPSGRTCASARPTAPAARRAACAPRTGRRAARRRRPRPAAASPGGRRASRRPRRPRRPPARRTPRRRARAGRTSPS